MATNYTEAEISEFLRKHLAPGKALTEEDCAIIKNTLGALIDIQAQLLFLSSELEIAAGDIGEVFNVIRDSGARVRNVLDSFKPGRNTYTRQELQDAVQLVEQTVAQFNTKIDIITGVLNRVPRLF